MNKTRIDLFFHLMIRSILRTRTGSNLSMGFLPWPAIIMIRHCYLFVKHLIQLAQSFDHYRKRQPPQGKVEAHKKMMFKGEL